MLQPIINKIIDLERKVHETPLTEENIREVRCLIISVLHDLATFLGGINDKLDHEICNGKFKIVKEEVIIGVNGLDFDSRIKEVHE